MRATAKQLSIALLQTITVKNNMPYLMKNMIFLFFVFLFMNSVYATECSQEIYNEADKNAINFNDWKSIYNYSKKYGDCIGSDTQESISESVVRILADRWDQLYILDELIKKDHSFKKFVVENITSTVYYEDLVKIHKNATEKCPHNLLKLCKSIDRESVISYKDIERLK